jgi:hypothetical protein
VHADPSKCKVNVVLAGFKAWFDSQEGAKSKEALPDNLRQALN